MQTSNWADDEPNALAKSARPPPSRALVRCKCSRKIFLDCPDDNPNASKNCHDLPASKPRWAPVRPENFLLILSLPASKSPTPRTKPGALQPRIGLQKLPYWNQSSPDPPPIEVRLSPEWRPKAEGQTTSLAANLPRLRLKPLPARPQVGPFERAPSFAISPLRPLTRALPTFASPPCQFLSGRKLGSNVPGHSLKISQTYSPIPAFRRPAQTQSGPDPMRNRARVEPKPSPELTTHIRIRLKKRS